MKKKNGSRTGNPRPKEKVGSGNSCLRIEIANLTQARTRSRAIPQAATS
jgi:hypothetical protein